MLVVRNVGGNANDGRAGALHPALDLHGDAAERPVLCGVPDHWRGGIGRDRLVDQRMREFRAARGKQRLAARGNNDHRQAGMTDQRVVKQLGNRRQILRRLHPCQRVTRQFELAVQHLQVLLDEVLLDSSANQVAKREHDQRRDDRKQNRQAQSD